MSWFGDPTEEEIERGVVSAISSIMQYKKNHDRCGARWYVGTSADDAEGRIAELFGDGSNPAVAVSVWEKTAAARAAREMAAYHGMELDGNPQGTDMYVYAYTDREPTVEERRKRPKEVLTVKQKRVFNAIKAHMDRIGRVPTQAELMRAMGHRSGSTTRQFLEILERKNWIIAPGHGERLEIL